MKPIFVPAPEKYSTGKKIVPDYATYNKPTYSVAEDDTHEGQIKKIYDRAQKVFARSQDVSVTNNTDTLLADGAISFELPCKAEDVAELAYLCTLGTAYDASVFAGKRKLENFWRTAFDSFVGNTVKNGSAVVGDMFQIADNSDATHKKMRIMRNMCYQAMEQGAEKAVTNHSACAFQTNSRMTRMRNYMGHLFDEVYHIPWNPPKPPQKTKIRPSV